MNDIVGTGYMQPSDTTNDFNAWNFVITRRLATVRTTVLVKVMAVRSQGELALAGTIDVQPLVSMLDGANVATDHETIFNVPYIRIQGGANAIIMDPAVGDIGYMGVCDRDISNVKEKKGVATPGSFRRFDLADGVYLGGILNGLPENYFRFGENEIEVVSTTKIKLRAPTVEIEASTLFHVTGESLITGNLTVTGAINAASAAITGAITAASAAITGAITAASVALSGALTALSAAITNLMAAGSITSSSTIAAGTGITAGTTIAATGVVSGDGHSLSTHVHVINVPSTPSGNLNSSAPVG